MGMFPALASTHFEITSAQTARYNCIAWAAGDDKRWWWPSADDFWPDGIPQDRTANAFIRAFSIAGYEVCQSEDLEPEFEKVALFTKPAGTVAHAARQLPSGEWTSKLGKDVDIAHSLRGLEGPTYGRVTVLLRRKKVHA